MKLTRILPKFLAKSWQGYDLNKTRAYFQYHKKMAQFYEHLVNEGEAEMKRLENK